MRISAEGRGWRNGFGDVVGWRGVLWVSLMIRMRVFTVCGSAMLCGSRLGVFEMEFGSRWKVLLLVVSWWIDAAWSLGCLRGRVTSLILGAANTRFTVSFSMESQMVSIMYQIYSEG